MVPGVLTYRYSGWAVPETRYRLSPPILGTSSAQRSDLAREVPATTLGSRFGVLAPASYRFAAYVAPTGWRA